MIPVICDGSFQSELLWLFGPAAAEQERDERCTKVEDREDKG